LAPTTLGILGGAVAIELVCYALYSFQSYNPSRRSRLLQPMLVSSLFLWSFLATSLDRKSTRLNSSHLVISYAVFCLKKKNDHVNESRHGARSEDILNAVDAAVEDGMDVLNLSLGGGFHGNNDLLSIGLDNAVDAGVV